MTRRSALFVVVLGLIGCGSPVALESTSPSYPTSTPIPTEAVDNPTPSPTPNPAQRVDPNSIVKISADGTVTITSPSGQVTFARVEDLYPSGPRTGIAGSVVDVSGNPVALAAIATQRPNGKPCKDTDTGIESSNQGLFWVSATPGPCLVVAGRNGRWSAPVLAEVTADHITPVQVIAP